MAKIKYRNEQGNWIEAAPSQKEFDDNKQQVAAQLVDINDQFSKLNKIAINVNKFNTHGNGQDDDTSAIQSALDFVFDQGGGIVYVPPGRYKLTDTLIIRSHVTMISSNQAFFLKCHLNEALTNFEKIKGDVKLTAYNGESDIQIIGGIWDNQGLEFLGGQCLVFAHAKNIMIKDLTILDVRFGHAIEINGVDSAIIDNIKAYGFSGESFRGAIQIDLDKDGTPGTLGAFGSFDGTPCKNIIVKNCVVGSSDKMGSWGRGIESHNCFIGVSHENIKLINNEISDTLDAGIRSYTWNNVFIKGNTLKNCGSGIIINPPLISKPEDLYDVNGNNIGMSQEQDSITIEDNLIDSTTMESGLLGGIAIWGQSNRGTLLNVFIKGNIIKNTSNSANAIYIKHCKNGEILNNIIINSGHNGVSVTASKRINIANNIFDSIGMTGIYCHNEQLNGDDDTDPDFISEDITINGNNINNCGGHGIHLQGSNYSSIKDNLVRNVGILLANRYNGIYASTGCTNISVSNNSIISVTKLLISAINITATNSLVHESQNFISHPELYFSNAIINQTSDYIDFHGCILIWNGSANGVSDTTYQLTIPVNNFNKIRITYTLNGSASRIKEFYIKDVKSVTLNESNISDTGGLIGYLNEAVIDFTDLSSFVITRDNQLNIIDTGNVFLEDANSFTIKKVEGIR